MINPSQPCSPALRTAETRSHPNERGDITLIGGICRNDRGLRGRSLGLGHGPWFSYNRLSRTLDLLN
jgi:hypothetical protein